MLTPRERGRLGGRPKTMGDRHQISSRFPVQIAETIFRIAEARGISANDWINEAVNEKMARTDLAVEDPQGQLPIDQQEAS